MPTSRVAEAYRLLSTKLLFSNPNTPALHSILISSAQGEDNTSEIAANMAVTLAQTGTRVILVDADLRRPAIAQLFDIADGRSLTDVLAKPSEPTELTTFDWAPGLSVLPGDPVPSNAFELLASPRMVTLIEQLKGQADILIIAAAPLLSHADSLILASHVDGVLFVARKGLIRRKMINNAMEHLRSLGAHVVGIVFNDSHRAPVHVALGRQAGDLVSRSSGDTLAIGRPLGPQMKSRRNGRHTAGQDVSSETVALASVPDRDRAALELLDAISREFAVQLDLRDLLPRVLRLTLEAVGASSGSIMVLDEKGEVIEGVVAYAGEVHREDAPNLTDTVARGLAGWVITHRQAALIPNTRDDPRWLSRSWADSDSTSRSAISVPLLSCDRVMGVLTLGHPQPGLFTEGDLSLLTAVSTHISFNADQPTAEDVSFPETVISGPAAEGEMSGDSPLTRPADDPTEARSVATASLETR
jgi:capsular exopolysaccharide synthesis family protein